MDFEKYELKQSDIMRDEAILHKMSVDLENFKNMFLDQAKKLSLAYEAKVEKSINDYFSELEYDVIKYYSDGIERLDSDTMEKDERNMYYTRII